MKPENPSASPERQEVELKYLLPDAQAFTALLTLVGGSQVAPVRQVNHFFDTPEKRLRQKKLLLRLREEGTSFFLTAKGRSTRSSDGFLSAKSEAELELPAETARSVLAGSLSPLDLLESSHVYAENPHLLAELRSVLGAQRPSLVGHFVNERTRVPTTLQTSSGVAQVTLELDRTSFPGGRTDFELEVEIPPGVDSSAVQGAVEALLARISVPPKGAPGKSKRFFALLDPT